MLRDLAAGKAEALVVAKLDRLGRDTADILWLADLAGREHRQHQASVRRAGVEVDVEDRESPVLAPPSPDGSGTSSRSAPAPRSRRSREGEAPRGALALTRRFARGVPYRTRVLADGLGREEAVFAEREAIRGLRRPLNTSGPVRSWL